MVIIYHVNVQTNGTKASGVFVFMLFFVVIIQAHSSKALGFLFLFFMFCSVVNVQAFSDHSFGDRSPDLNLVCSCFFMSA